MVRSVPHIFDRRLLAGRRTRMAAGFAAYDFLHRRMANELVERLSGLERHFATGLLIGSYGGLLDKALKKTSRHFIECFIEADLSAAMLSRNPLALVLDEEHLPIADASCDLIVSFWGLHHANDLPGALIQIRRALKPGGLFVGTMAGNRTLANLRHALLAAETELTSGAGAHIHPFADIRDLGGLMQRAQFDEPIVDSDVVTINYVDPMRVFTDLRGMGENNCLTARPRRPLRRDVLAHAIAQLNSQPIDFEICYLMGKAAS